jgi:hypothetical protein
MAYFPCPNVIACPPGTDAENAAQRNFSAELPDEFTYFGQFQCGDGINPPYSVCTSVKSQRDADLCAALCLPDDAFANTEQVCRNACASYTVPARMFVGISQQNADQLALAYACASLGTLCQFGNAAQTCIADCAGGGMESYTVPAGSILAASQAIANTEAYNVACSAAALLCFGAIVFNTEQSCTVTCPNGGSITYTLPAGVVAGLSQSEANASAQSLACTLGMLACPLVPPLVGNTEQTCAQDCAGVSVAYIVPAGAFLGVDQSSADGAAYAYACSVLSEACQTGIQPPTMNVGNTEQTCEIACAGGGTFTSTVAAGVFRSVNLAAANAAAASYACEKANAVQFCLDSIDTQVCAGSVYASFVSTAGPGSGIVFAITSGTLPPGLTFSQGVIAGIPSVGGTYAFTVQGQDGTGNFTERDYTITVSQFLTTSLPGGSIGVAYLQTVQVVGFTNPYFTVAGGALPTGLSIDSSSGVISGTPSGSAGASSFVIECSDGVGGTPTCSVPLQITVSISSLFHIPDYGGATALFVPPGTANASAFPEWDGRYYEDNAGFLGFTECYTPSVDPNTPEYSDQGKELYQVYLAGPNPATGFIPNVFWTLTVKSLPAFPDFGRVWQGYKVGGDTTTPVGVYVRGDVYIPQNMSDPRANVTIAAG